MNGMQLPHGLSAGGLSNTCARLLVPTCAAKSGVQKPDLSAVANRKRQYVQRLPAAALMSDLPYGGMQKLQGPQGTASDLERFKHMNGTVFLRLTPGKSGIHGIGVFARAPISAGDWVIEYVGANSRLEVHDVVVVQATKCFLCTAVRCCRFCADLNRSAGELIRPPVLDVREQRMYDKMIGGGTYTFRLPCEDGDLSLIHI